MLIRPRYAISLVSMIMVCTTRLPAQYYAEPDTSTIISYRNTLGLYLNPLAVTMLGGDPEGTRFGLQYKRQLSDFKRLRLSGLYERSESSQLHVPVSYSDSSAILVSTTDSYRDYQLRGGVEWSNYTENIDAFYGFDISVGYQRENFEYLQTERIVHVYHPDSANYRPYGDVLSDSLAGVTSAYISVGLAPVIGWRFNIRSRFELCASLSPEITYRAHVSDDWYDGGPASVRQSPPNALEFRLRLLDLVLSYCF